MIRYIPTAAILLLAGCAAGSHGPTPKGTVLAMESALTAAEGIAKQYVALPACATGGPVVCADPNIVTQIKSDDNEAYNLITAAQAAVDGDPSASSSATTTAITDATAALQALQALTSNLKV